MCGSNTLLGIYLPRYIPRYVCIAHILEPLIQNLLNGKYLVRMNAGKSESILPKYFVGILSIICNTA